MSTEPPRVRLERLPFDELEREYQSAMKAGMGSPPHSGTLCGGQCYRHQIHFQYHKRLHERTA